MPGSLLIVASSSRRAEIAAPYDAAALFPLAGGFDFVPMAAASTVLPETVVIHHTHSRERSSVRSRPARRYDGARSIAYELRTTINHCQENISKIACYGRQLI